MSATLVGAANLLGGVTLLPPPSLNCWPAPRVQTPTAQSNAGGVTPLLEGVAGELRFALVAPAVVVCS
jgi:hypothetical protein